MTFRCVTLVTVISLAPHIAWAQATTRQPAPSPPAPTTPSTTKPPAPAPSTAKPAAPAPSTAKPAAPAPATATTVPPTQPAGVAVPGDFRIGAEDVLGILFWREMEMSGDVTVRPDGMITLPLIGDVRAVGMTTDQLRDVLQKNATKFLTDANVTVVVRQINSRKVYVQGQVGMSGAYPLIGPRNVLQAIAMAGGLSEYAKGDKIQIIRGNTTFKFNYKEVLDGKKLEQNIQLQPGDTVLVP
jgi:polysaccharide biosynthesis/export protein